MIDGIRGGRVLLPDGSVTETELRFDGGHIGAVGDAGSACLDARGLLVLPGLIDIHGDAFERQLMPRPGVRFPHEMALIDTDRQLLANGITTAFHGITCSWEGGLRGTEQATQLIDAIAHDRLPLGADHRVHLRFETHHVDALDRVIEWIDAGHIDFLAFNDHLAHIQAKSGNGGLKSYAERSGVSEAEFRELLDRTAAQRDRVPPTIHRIAEHARAAQLALASHDDDTEEERRWYHQHGCAVSEFPRTDEAMHAAQTLGNHVIMGAPNVVRGGSHCNAANAIDAVGHGVCNVLASDYYYPALVHAPFRLAREGVTDFGRAWSLVSGNPARAAGLADRGEIRAGQRADLVLVDNRDPRLPQVVGTIVGGRLKFSLDTRSSA